MSRPLGATVAAAADHDTLEPVREPGDEKLGSAPWLKAGLIRSRAISSFGVFSSAFAGT